MNKDIFRSDSALSYLYKTLSNEKDHSEAQVVGEMRGRYSLTPLGALLKLRRFRERGEKLGIFTLERGEGKIRMRFIKDPKPPLSRDVLEKDLRIVCTLLRRVMSSGVWTEDKLIEHLSGAGYEVPADEVRAAIQTELDNGGLSEEKGVLYLT